jgi:hypothetical protein
MNRDTDKNTQRAYWLKTLHQWHWISSAICLIGLLLFALSGITLNHAGQIESRPQVTTRSTQLPPAEIGWLTEAEGPKSPLPEALRAWIDERMDVDVGERPAEWSEAEVYVSLPRPGGDAWLRIDRDTGAVEYELTDRGWIAFLNDLHKGRNTGGAWSLFIDVFALACLVFAISGLFILKLHVGNRPSTWPLVGLGLVLPVLLAILFIH